MKERIDELKITFEGALSCAQDKDALEALRVEYLGKKGYVAELMKGLKDAADKKAAGALINGLKTYVEDAIAKKTEELSALELSKRIREAKKFNPTLV